MGLTYHFGFAAPREAESRELLAFLASVENAAINMGFSPTLVVDAPFDSAEKRLWARRITTGLPVEDERFRTANVDEVLFFNPPAKGESRVRLCPEHGALLLLTDERGVEIAFGFLRYPCEIHDRSGATIIAVPDARDWTFRNHIKSPDPRYRKIVKMFADAGFLSAEIDEFDRLTSTRTDRA